MEWARVRGPLKRAAGENACGGGRRRSAWRGLALGLGLTLGLGLSGACRGPTPAPPEPQPVATAPAPTWIGQPLSWDKLDAIESWLVEASHTHDATLELQARLELAEGRLEFARRDLASSASRNLATLSRLEQARLGFERVLADSRSSAAQQARARDGLASARAVAGRPASGHVAVLPRTTWKARPARAREMTPVGGRWNRITVHHSADVEDEGVQGSLQETVSTLLRIQKVHMDPGDPNHGWGDIGYHFLIDPSGRILEGRQLDWQGAHARGDNNRTNVGVCVLGDYSRHAPSPAALQALERLLDDLSERFGIARSRVLVHKELVATDCPGPSLSAWVQRYRKRGGPRP